MSNRWEETFNTWSQSPSQTETDRIENAVSAIRKALAADDFLAQNTKVYVQGSYRNRVNVRQESDVDIGVLYTGKTFYPQYPAGMNKDDFDNIAATYTFLEFKDAIGRALVNRFGTAAVSRGNKAFDVHANTYRVDADVVPVFINRKYKEDKNYICGVRLISDDGQNIVNWPERLYDNNHWPDQHYENSVRKNNDTSRVYKGVTRILKKLRHVMEEEGSISAKNVAGFQIECLTWNVPNERLRHSTWNDNMNEALIYLYSNTMSIETCNDWNEVSQLKSLFRGQPQEKLQNANIFLLDALSRLGLNR